MKACPFCAENIQDTATVCRFCQRSLPSTQIKTPAQRRWLAGMIFGGIGLIGIVMAVTVPTPSQSKMFEITVAWSGLALKITNTGSAEAAGSPFTAYINGTPPFTYKAEATMPAVGESVQILLNRFVAKDGARFNPLTHAVTVAWIGGNGYDYQQFKYR